MSSFDDLMNDLGVKPIKKDEKKQKSGNEKLISQLEKSINKEAMAELIEKDNLSFSKNKVQKKSKKHKEDFSNSFEEALKLYTPQMEEENLFKGNSSNKKVFYERFSEIEEDNIMYTIDLHGKTLDNAIALVKDKLIWCYREKFDNILIITGKGKHSDNGPILKIGIKNLLINMANLIELIEYAPKFLGGEGAYVIKIKL